MARIRADADAARIRVLHRHGRRGAELHDEPERGVRVVDVVVRELFAAQLLRRGDGRSARIRPEPVKGRPLVRVFPVAQVLQLGQMNSPALRENGLAMARRRVGPCVGVPGRPGIGAGLRHGTGGRCRLGLRLQPGRQPVAHGPVVAGRMPKRRQRQPPPHGGGNSARRGQRLQHVIVISRPHDDDHVPVIFGRRPHQRGTADIDVLHRVPPRDVRPRHRLLERIQVDAHHVDGVDAVASQVVPVRRVVPIGQNAAVHLRVQRLDPAAQQFGKTGQLLHRSHGQPRRRQMTHGAAGGQQLEPEPYQPSGKLDDAGFVGHAQQRALRSGHGVTLPTHTKTALRP